MDDEDFLAAVEADNAGTPVAEEPKAETPAGPTPATEAAPEPEATPQSAEPEVLELTEVAPGTPKPEPGFVPLAAMLDERDRAKALKAELDQLRASQQQQQPVQAPDPIEDPEGFANWQQATVGQALYQTNLRWSERIASIQHGADTVAKAKEWGFQRCETDPYFNAKVAASDDPVGFVVSEWKREEIASQVTPDEFAQFRAWKEAQGQLKQQAAPAATPKQTSAIPPPSLASAPSAGTILTEPVQSEEEIFDEVIGKR